VSDIKLKFAKIISTVFLQPTFSFLNFTYLNFNYEQSSSQLIVNLLISLSATVILPIIYFVIQRRNGNIHDNDAVIKEQRNNTYIFTIVLFLIASILLYLNKAPVLITSLMLCYFINTSLVFLINLFYKISVHTFTAAGSLALFTFISPILAGILSIITLAVMWSRIQLKVHTKGQVILGLVCGIFLTLIGLKLFAELIA